ncbi:MAG: hypothetical protein U0800_15730 [Isosphaeraceae bacterium]
MKKAKESLTGRYLSGEAAIPVPTNRRSAKDVPRLTVVGARHHNLKDLTVGFPLGLVTAVTASAVGQEHAGRGDPLEGDRQGVYTGAGGPRAHDQIQARSRSIR